MKKRNYLNFFYFLIFPLSFFLVSCKTNINNNNNNLIEVKDMVGDKVFVPKNPKKVACISRTTFDLLVGYGLQDSIYGAYDGTLNNPWLKLILGEKAKKIVSLPYNPSAEELIKNNVDLVFAPEKIMAEEYRKQGINAITISLYGNPSFDNFIFFFSDLIEQIWDSEIVKIRSNIWENELEKVLNEISTKLPKNNQQKKKIFYVRGDKERGINYTDTIGSLTEFVYRTLNLDFVGSIINVTRPSDEEIIKIDPDYFAFGGIYQNKNIQVLKEKSIYKNLSAVKNGNYFNIPIALTAFEQLSIMTPVFICDQANKIYPDIFNFNIDSLVKEYIKYYFDFDLNSNQIQWIKQGYGPNGESMV